MITLTLLAACLIGFTACLKDDPDTSAKKVVIIIGESRFDVETESAYLLDILNALKDERKISSFDFSGGFISQIDTLSPVGNQFIAIYHDIDKADLKMLDYEDPSAGYMKKNVDGKVFFASLAGAAELPITDGHTYLLMIDTW